MRLIPRNLAALGKLCSAEANRFAITGLLLEETPDNNYLAVATDGKVLGVLEGTGDDPSSHPVSAAKGMVDAPNGKTSGIVPKKDLESACKAAPKGRKCPKPICESIAVVFGENEATFGSTDLETVNIGSARLMDGRFPDYPNVFPRSQPVVEFTVNPDCLARLCTVASEYADEDNPRVKITVYHPEKPVLLECSTTTQKFRGLIMPLSGDSKEPVFKQVYALLEVKDGKEELVGIYDNFLGYQRGLELHKEGRGDYILVTHHVNGEKGDTYWKCDEEIPRERRWDEAQSEV